MITGDLGEIALSSTQSLTADNSSAAKLAGSQLALKKLFGWTLFFATALPSFLALLNLFSINQANALAKLIIFVAGIHVPMTTYLFFDPAIRTQMRNSPLKFIAVPTALFAICVAVFLWNTPDIMEEKAVFLTYFLIAILAWNFWHFGKQNIGVYAYFRLSQSAGGMLPIEKQLINVGAFLGALSACFLAPVFGYQTLYARSVNLDLLDQISGYVGVFGKYLQIGLAVFTVIHIVRNLSRFDAKSALMFYLCVNFYLPAYLSIGSQRWLGFFMSSTAAHGAQYMLFLLFHSYYARHAIPTTARAFDASFVTIRRYLIIFVVLCLIAGDVFSWHIITPIYHFADKATDAYFMSVVTGLATGMLVTHFWLDSFFWKFTKKESRDWILARYSFLFKT
jgi:hypothetical protein